MRRAGRAVESIVCESIGIAQSHDVMRNLLQDVRFGLRVLSGSPAFASLAILTLGLGIACTTTVFSWVDGVLLHPYAGAGRKIGLHGHTIPAETDSAERQSGNARYVDTKRSRCGQAIGHDAFAAGFGNGG